MANSVSRSLSVASLDGWVDIVPTAQRSRKPSIDSMSSWCFAGDEVVEPDLDELVHDELPVPPVHLHASRRSSLASWDGDELLFERQQPSSSNSSGNGSSSGSGGSYGGVVGSVDSGGYGVEGGYGGSGAAVAAVGGGDRSGSYHREEEEEEENHLGPECMVEEERRNRNRRVRDERRARQVVPQGERQWACEHCSFLNHPLIPRCEMCDNPQGGPRLGVAVHAMPRAERSFADVVRDPLPGHQEDQSAAAQIPKRQLKLRAPRVRPHAGVAFMSRCRSTLLNSIAVGSGSVKGPFSSRKTMIQGIPEEDEDAVSDRVLAAWKQQQPVDEPDWDIDSIVELSEQEHIALSRATEEHGARMQAEDYD